MNTTENGRIFGKRQQQELDGAQMYRKIAEFTKKDTDRKTLLAISLAGDTLAMQNTSLFVAAISFANWSTGQKYSGDQPVN